MNSGNQTLFGVIAVAVLSGPGIWAFMQWLFGVRERRRAEDREQREKETRRDEKRREDDALLSRVQTAAQTSALRSARFENRGLRQGQRALHSALMELREATILLVDGFDKVLTRMKPSQNGTRLTITLDVAEAEDAKSTVNAARRHLLLGTNVLPVIPDEEEDWGEDELELENGE